MGDEVEFTYKGKLYSVFYKEPVEFYKAEDFMNNAKIENELLKNIWDKVVDISVF